MFPRPTAGRDEEDEVRCAAPCCAAVPLLGGHSGGAASLKPRLKVSAEAHLSGHRWVARGGAGQPIWPVIRYEARQDLTATIVAKVPPYGTFRTPLS